MHKTVLESVDLARSLVESLRGISSQVMIAPPFTALAGVKEIIKGSNIRLGAQNIGPEESGAHTGEVSILMLKDIGVEYVILGHSERRHTYNESDELIAKKVNLALKYQMNIILCVGETLAEKEQAATEQVVERQTKSGLGDVSQAQLQNVTIAYEPVWAIGTGKTATPEDADSVHGFLRNLIAQKYNRSAADSLIIQYGGSVKPGNVKDLMAMENIDGALVGGAALQAETFLPIAKFDQT